MRRRRGRRSPRSSIKIPAKRSGDPMGLFDRGSGQSTAQFRASRSRAPSSAISTRCAISSPHIPRDVALGYHFCFGTLGGWPRFQPDDLGQTVKLANAFVAASGRPVDWIHIPVLDRSDDAFFAPLARTRPARRARLSRRHSQYDAVQRATSQPRANICLSSASAPIAASGASRLSALPRILNDHLDAVAIAAKA